MSKSQFLGIGTDIIEVERIVKSLEKHGEHFLNRLFTPKEKSYCLELKDPSPRVAGRFAAKEAIIKALGEGCEFREIEILNESNGKPTVTLSDALSKKFPGIQILISISHCRSHATATALVVPNA